MTAIERRRSYITDLVGLVLMKPDLRSCEEDLLVDEITGSDRLKSADAYFSSAKFALAVASSSDRVSGNGRHNGTG
jgi:hypothetical protein